MIVVAVPAPQRRDVEFITVDGKAGIPRNVPHRGRQSSIGDRSSAHRQLAGGGGGDLLPRRRGRRSHRLSGLLVSDGRPVLYIAGTEAGGDDGDLHLVLRAVVNQ